MAVSLIAGFASAVAQDDTEERLSVVEQKLEQWSKQSEYMPKLHGILRGKYEYEPELGASRFEVRNARLSVEGKFFGRSEYKLEVDLCDESEIKMKDAWVRLNPYKTLRFTIGQQRMPFTIDAHRNPSAQYFANRSFIAKQVGDMRDVGFQAGWDFLDGSKRKVLSVDAGIFNGSNLDNQKTAWFKSPGYSARLQYYPVKGLVIVPSVQHQQIADRKASYTSIDIGACYERSGWHVEGEYLRKMYGNDAFSDCSALQTMLMYKHAIRGNNSFIESVSGLGRYDYMQDHSSGKSGMADDGKTLIMTDAERHRMTLGVTLGVRNPYFRTEIRVNYENYWYPHGGAKESEQDKIVCELMIKF
ncbi:MAG: porin [Muribaculaceae bacterium]